MNDTLRRLRRLATAGNNRRQRATEAAECIRAARGYHWVGLYDVKVSEISAIAWTGPTAPAHPTFPRTQGLNGAAVSHGGPLVVQDVGNDPRYLTTFGATLAEAIFPVRAPNGAIVGTIDVESDRAHSFAPEDEHFLSLCADALAELFMNVT